MNLSKETNDKELNPLFSIWTKPRQTVRQVIEERRSSYIFLLLVLSGYAAVLIGALDTASDQAFGIGALLIVGLIISPLVALIGNALGSLVSLLVGKIFKGTATYSEMFRALLAGQIPQMWLIPVLLLWIFLWPSSYFTETPLAYSGTDSVLNGVLSAILFVISIWTFVVQSKAVGEAHGLSAWKGAAIILIPLAVLTIVAILFIVFVIFS